MENLIKKLPAKWIPFVILLIWGAFLGIGIKLSFYRESMLTVAIIVTIILLIAWIAIIIMAVRKSKKESDIRRMSETAFAGSRRVNNLEDKLLFAINALRESKVGKVVGKADAQYAIPWYMLIGPIGSGKTNLFMNSGLDFKLHDPSVTKVPAGATRDCNWFFENEAIIMDTSGRYVTQPDKSIDKAEWLVFLENLKRYRKAKPMDGIIIAVDISKILPAMEEEIEYEAQNIRDKIDDVVEKLGISLPVYLVFTKCDMIQGFSDFFNKLSKEERNQILGCSFTAQQQNNMATTFKDEWFSLCSSLKSYIHTALTPDTDMRLRRGIYLFPKQLELSFGKINSFVSILSRPSIYLERPTLQGFYLTSSLQDQSSIDLLLSDLDRLYNIHVSSSTTYSPETKSFFARDLFLKNVFPLQGYVNPTTKEWRKNLIRWLIPLAFEFVFLAIIMIGISFSFTYTQNLINSSNTVAKRISSLGNAITSTDISELQNQIDSLKSFHIFPWRGQRLKVAKALERKFFIDFPIKVVKEPGGNEKPKALSNVILYEENHSDKQVKTDKNGEAILRAFKGKNTSQICIKVDHQEAGFGIDKVMIETEGNQSEQMLMEPLLKLDARSIYHNVLILYSKIRVLVAQIYNDKRAPVSNVPVSISDPAIPFPLANSFSDDIGTARLEFHSKDNAILNVEFGESDIGYPSAKHLRIDPGKYDYAMEEMIRTKPSGSDLIAESSKEDAIQTNPLGKSIKLVTKSKEPVPSAEVWIFIDNETLFKNTKEKDRIQIDLPGKRYRLVRCKDKTNNSGQLMLPTSAQTLLLLYNPEYWPRVIRIDQINKPIEMFDIHNERLIVEDFDQSLVEGAKYLYNQGRREYKYHRLNSAILLYEKAIRLVPMKEYYWALALAYSDSGKKEQALDVVSRGLDINLKDSEKQNKKYQDELENLRKKLKSKR